MYGLPPDFDPQPLVGRTLEMVCFAAYQLFLHFDGAVLISVGSAYSYPDEQRHTLPVSTSALMALIGQAVTGAEGTTDGTLSLQFATGETLRIFDNSPVYESYSIAFGDRVIYV